MKIDPNTINKINYVDVTYEGWDDGDPLYEVEFGIEFKDGSVHDFFCDCRRGHLDALRSNNLVEVKKWITDRNTIGTGLTLLP